MVFLLAYNLKSKIHTNAKVAIIGAGPAGITTAIQLKRYGIESVLFEKELVGGLVRNAHWIENYPGFPRGISGLNLFQLFKQHSRRWKVKVIHEEVLKLDYRKKKFLLKTPKQIYSPRIVVIATGTKPIRLPEQLISTKIQKRIFYDVYPLRTIVNKLIGIIGSGDIAFDYALHLAQNNKVLLFNRNKSAKCIPLLCNQSRKNKNIKYFAETSVWIILEHQSGLLLRCRTKHFEWETDISYLLVAIGREPNLDFLAINIKKNLKQLQAEKLLYLIGDVKNDIYRQVAIAVGDGMKAAMEIYRKITGENSCE